MVIITGITHVRIEFLQNLNGGSVLDNFFENYFHDKPKNMLSKKKNLSLQKDCQKRKMVIKSN